MTDKWHRHLGAYGICLDQAQSKLLLIKKTAGPYRGRYDLPGGTIEPMEALTAAVRREFLEETDLAVEVTQSIGTFDFLVRCPFKDTSHTHHIAAMYEVKHLDPDDGLKITQNTSDDSGGSVWVTLDALQDQCISPLVTKALEWIRNGKATHDMTVYDEWVVYEGWAARLGLK